MFRRLKRAGSSRAAGKFRRNRLAVAGLAVIALYVLTGAWVMFADLAATTGKRTGWWNFSTHPALGALTLDSVEAVVGAKSSPGWLEKPRPEQRMRAAKDVLEEFRKIERVQDKATALAGITLGGRHVSRAWEETRPIYKDAKDLYDDLDATENLDTSPETLPRLATLEEKIDSLFSARTGLGATVDDLRLSAGTDRQGRSILFRAIYSIKVALQIGFIVALISVGLGSVIGAAAGFFGGWVDAFVTWLFSTLSSVPDLVLLAVLAYMFTGSMFDQPEKPFLSLIPVYAAMCMTFWIGPCRVIRGEVMKLKELEYVQAATAIGYPRSRILLKHVLPNTMHLMFINFSLLFIAAIKFEVVLSFLNLGVKAGPSWGRIMQESTQEVINGNFWQIGAATVFMFVLVLAFNIVSDALQDAFDPKHVG